MRSDPTTWADRCFWPKVAVGGPDDCWPWQGYRQPKGYGQLRRERRGFLAHRVAYERVRGAVPPGVCVLHRCDTPACCNPSHLFLGSRGDNNADMMAKGRYARGETNGQSKLTREDVAYIRESPWTQVELAERFGVGQSLISRVRARKVWVER